MDDYISREAAENLFYTVDPENDGSDGGTIILMPGTYNSAEIDAMLENLPAADVEPVVRCRECKHHYWVQEPCHGKSVHYCKLPHMSGVEVFKEFFCYYGERKEGADNG